jgi:hypothetical protein
MKEKLIERIKEAIERDNLASENRQQQFHYRRIFLYSLLRKHGVNLSNSGRIFNRNHSTIINGLKIYDQIRKDPVFLAYIESYHREFSEFYHVNTKTWNLEEEVLSCNSYWEMCKLQELIKEKRNKSKRFEQSEQNAS